MAKVRVYELARELNMESKNLVEKLKSGGMNIKNYMSTLDNEAIIRARDIVSGTVSEIIEEKRIKPTVIRRRKKTVKVGEKEPLLKQDDEAKKVVEVEPIESVQHQEERMKSFKPDLQKVEKETKKEDEKVEKKQISEDVPAEEMKSIPDKPKSLEPPAEKKPKQKVKKPKKKRADRPAKIIKRPEEGPLKEVIANKKKEEARTDKLVLESIPPQEETPAIEEKKERPAKKKKGKKGFGKKEEMSVRVIRHRRVEVFEKADLYTGRAPKRKEKRGAKKAGETIKDLKQTEITTPKAIKRRIKIQEHVTVAELAKTMGIKAVMLIKKLLSLGTKTSINQSIDFETASVVADEYGYELELDVFKAENMIAEIEDKPEDLLPRPPVVTIMGHVDHGKTSLLDYIRKSNIIGGESGGITQHIGAYYFKREGGDLVFLDTPGHEAFTAMRARGAKVTDIIVLVVAADDGVMPQTLEAINHARAANIPIIVAVNKIDKPGAEPDKVRRELAELNLIPEEWSGDTIFGNISAKTGEGVDELLELIWLQSEILELKANPNKPARGTIIEAKLDKTRGSVATVLIQHGTLKQGDYFICGDFFGKVRAMVNHRRKRMISASPSVPVEIYGISGVPMAGDTFIVVKDEKTAKQIIEHRKSRLKIKDMARRGIVSLDDLFHKISKGEVKELNIIIKTDVQGSLEALSESLIKLSTEDVKLKIIHSSTGAITESDVMLASASGAIIIGFNVRTNPRVTEIAEKEKVDIRYYEVIYNVIKDVRLAMVGLLEPVYEENIIGRADVKEIFHVPKVGSVAGCHVSEGHLEKNANIRLLRDDVVIFDGKLASLRRFKDDVKEVQSGYECGIGIENYQDIKPGDVIEAYLLEEIAAEL